MTVTLTNFYKTRTRRLPCRRVRSAREREGAAGDDGARRREMYVCMYVCPLLLVHVYIGSIDHMRTSIQHTHMHTNMHGYVHT